MAGRAARAAAAKASGGLCKNDLAILLEKVKGAKGWDFRGYKTESLLRTVYRRLCALRIGSISEYMVYLDTDHREYFKLFSHMTLKVSEFFRDPEIFDVLAGELGALWGPKAGYTGRKKGVRAWCCGVAHGQEAYSLAILLARILSHEAFVRTRVFATDIDHMAIEDAREGLYRAESVLGVGPAALARYFTRSGETYGVNEEIRQVVKFGTLDIVKGSPLSKIDILFCRNLFIYFKKPLQVEVFAKLDFALSPGGFMVMGEAESMPPEFAGSYARIAATRVYRKRSH